MIDSNRVMVMAEGTDSEVDTRHRELKLSKSSIGQAYCLALPSFSLVLRVTMQFRSVWQADFV